MTTATRSHALGVPGYSETWPCERESASRARSLVRLALSAWRLEELSEDAVSVVSELVSNSVVHTRCRLVRVDVTLRSPESIRIGVTDSSTCLPRTRGRGGEEAVGRGLFLVEQFSHDWGVQRLSCGKTVWAELVAHQAGGAGPLPHHSAREG